MNTISSLPMPRSLAPKRPHTRLLLLLALTAGFLAALFLPFPSHAEAPPPPPRSHAKAPRPIPPSTKTKDLRETLILPIRYIDGSRLSGMLRLFVPSEHRDTEIRYSPSLHKILIRAQPALLQTLKEAAEKLDQAQTQFGVRIYFVESTEEYTKAPQEHLPPALTATLQRIFPQSKGFTLLEKLYIHAINHEQARFKITRSPRPSAPSLLLTLHQAPQPASPVLVEFQIMHHEAFSGKDKTQFVSSIHLSTKLFVALDNFALIGHTPLQMADISDKSAPAGRKKALVLIKIERPQTSLPTPYAEAPTQNVKNAVPTTPNQPDITVPQKTQETQPSPVLGSLDKNSIRKVIRKGIARFKACYESELVKQPTLKGRVVISFVIQADGSVKDSKASSTTLHSPAVENCLVERFQQLQFPQPLHGGVVRVNYPLVFSPN